LPLVWKRKRSKLDETAMSTVSIEGVTVSATPARPPARRLERVVTRAELAVEDVVEVGGRLME